MGSAASTFLVAAVLVTALILRMRYLHAMPSHIVRQLVRQRLGDWLATSTAAGVTSTETASLVPQQITGNPTNNSFPLLPTTHGADCIIQAGDLLLLRRRDKPSHVMSHAVAGALTSHAAMCLGVHDGRLWIIHATARAGVAIVPFQPSAKHAVLVHRRLLCTPQQRKELFDVALTHAGKRFSGSFFQRGLSIMLAGEDIQDARTGGFFCTSLVVSILQHAGLLSRHDGELWASDDLLLEGFTGPHLPPHRRRKLPWTAGCGWAPPAILDLDKG